MPYVVIEGMDGCGKSTQVELLAKRLIEQFGADKVMVTREPGGTRVAEILRDIHKGKLGPITKETEILVLAAARAELKVEIQKALEEGKWVISDRNYVSSYAYQGYGFQRLREVTELHELFELTLKPDYFFLLEMSADARNARLQSRATNDRIEIRDDNFFKQVAWGYSNIYVPTHVLDRTLDANRSAESIHQEIWESLKF